MINLLNLIPVQVSRGRVRRRLQVHGWRVAMTSPSPRRARTVCPRKYSGRTSMDDDGDARICMGLIALHGINLVGTDIYQTNEFK